MSIPDLASQRGAEHDAGRLLDRPLFRAEALEAQRSGLQGGVLIAAPLPLRLLVVASLLAAALIVAYGVWGEYTRKEAVSGFLAPSQGLIRIHAPRVGIVVERHVREGQTVAKGDALFTITNEIATAHAGGLFATARAQLESRRDNLRAVIANQRAADALALEALATRVRGLEAEIAQAGTQQALQARRVESAERDLQRYRELVSARFVSEATMQQKHDALLEQQGTLAGHTRSMAALGRELEDARGALQSARLRQPNTVAALEREVLEIEQQLTESEARRELRVTAPADGTITTVLTDIGQRVDADMPLASILPAGATLEATLLVPTRAAGFIRSGQRVALRYQAFPHQRYGHHEGEVISVGRALIQPGDARLPVSPGEPAYPVTVRIAAQAVVAHGQAHPLQPGMLLDADVQLERRRIVEWMFDPLRAIAGRV